MVGENTHHPIFRAHLAEPSASGAPFSLVFRIPASRRWSDMFTTLSAENRALPLLRDLGCSNAFTAALVGIEESRLSRALRLLRPLPNDEGLRLINTLQRLIELRDAMRPLCIDLRPIAGEKNLGRVRGIGCGASSRKDFDVVP